MEAAQPVSPCLLIDSRQRVQPAYCLGRSWQHGHISGNCLANIHCRAEKLGRSQAVRQRVLIPSCAGSNPAAPAIFVLTLNNQVGVGRQDENRRFDPNTQCEGTKERSDIGRAGVRREAPNNPAAPANLSSSLELGSVCGTVRTSERSQEKRV